MNKHRYRIIFNKARGLLIAVAETVAGQGKTSGETPAPSASSKRAVAAVRPLTFFIWGLMGMVTAPAGHTQIVADPGAPGGQRPTVLAAPNNVPLVNIQTPSAAGVSRNTYSQFDVQQQGAILNNSRTNVQTQLGGFVQGNPWLATGSARVILNEVNSSNPSQLRGYIEVGGSRAQVVIANPAGVTCDGCGFINASRATVTTGTPVLNGGNLEGYRVQGGTVAVNGNGMDARTTDYTDVIARAVQVNAGIWANQLKVIAGANQVSIDAASGEHSVAASMGGAGSTPAFAIDVAQLGGMYAGKITLVGSEAGVGVRNAGTLYAGVGDVVVTSGGQLQNAGQINSAGHFQADAQNGVQNTGTVYAQGTATLATRGNIDNSGVIAAQGDTTLNATGASSLITSGTGAVLGAGVQADGSLGTSGTLAIGATQAIAAQGQNLSGGDQSFSALAVSLSGSQTMARNLTVTASGGDVNLAKASVSVGQTLTASASQTLRTDKGSVAARQINAYAHDLSNVQGEILQTGAGDLSFNLPGSLDNTAGRIAADSTNLNLAAAVLSNAGGSVLHAGAGALKIDAGTLNGQGGTISSSGALTMTGGRLDNTSGQITAAQTLTVSATQAFTNSGGLFAANGQVILTAGRIDNNAGTIGSVRNGVDLTAGTGTLNNQGGRIEAALVSRISAQGVVNTDGTITGKALSVNSQSQAFDNTRGKLVASGAAVGDTLDIQSGALTNESGLIQATAAVTVNTHGQTLANTNSGTAGGILGQGAVSLTTGDLNNQAGYVGSGGLLTINGAAITNTGGGNLVSSAAARVTAASFDNRGGKLQAVGDAGIDLTGTLNNTGSLLRSGQTLGVTAASIVNTSTQDTNQGLEGNEVTLSASSIGNSVGAIRANNNTTLSSSGTIDNASGLVSGGNTLTARDFAPGKALVITNTSGTFIAGQQLVVDSAGLGGNGKLLSQGDLQIKLTQDFVNSGQVIANGNASIETAAGVINQATLAAGRNLTLKGASIDNQADGTITGGSLTLQSAGGTITNRGLINGGETSLVAQTVNNLGTGRIYGDHVAIGAVTVNNPMEGGTAPVIAARSRLDIGAATINNREHALMFSAGDLAIGGALDPVTQRATGRASELNNASATIEALGAAGISAGTINNTNEHFSTTTETLPSQSILEYQGEGSPYRYLAGTPGIYVVKYESDVLHTPDIEFESWVALNYTRNTTETRVGSSDPAQILSGSGMQFAAETINNDKSRIIAGGALTGSIGTVNNVEAPGERVITDVGIATSYWRDHRSGRDRTGTSTTGYAPAPVIQAISLTPTVYQQNTQPGDSGTQVSALSTTTVSQAPGSVGSAGVTLQGGQRITPIAQVALATNASGPAFVVRTGGINTSIPNNRLFALAPDSSAHYLIETDPQFANYRNWLSSDYLLQALSIDPSLTQKRLGDGFYEQKLIREQVAQLTGRRFLDGYANDEAEYAALMDAGVTYARAYNLVPGISLNAAQMAQLTSDIVWLVEKDITQPDGSTVKALVSQLYVRVQDGDLQSGGALIAGDSVNLNIRGDLTNSGTIAGRTVVALTAENINNMGGRIVGQDVGLAARTDLNNISGTVAAGNRLVASAGRDLNVLSTTSTQANAQGSQTHIDRVAGLYVTGAGGTLVASAGRDANIVAGIVSNSGQGGNTAIVAGNNLNLGTVTQASSNNITWNATNKRSDASTAEAGSAIQSQGNLTLQAGNDINAKAATVQAGGALAAVAGRDVNLDAGQNTQVVDEAHQHKEKGFLSSTTITTQDNVNQTGSIGTSLSGGTVNVQAGNDINVKGSSVVSDNGTVLAAKNNVNILAATNTSDEEHLRDEKKSGLFSGGGIGVTIGTRKQSTDASTQSTSAAASTVGAINGDVTIRAGNTYTQTGSDVMAPGGNVDILAKDVKITESRETSNSQTEQKFSQSGLTLALTSPVLSAIQTVGQMASAAGKTSDGRMQALAAASGALAANNAVNAVKAGQGVDYAGKANQVLIKDQAGNVKGSRDATAAERSGGVNLSISLGGSSSQSNRATQGDSARGSSVAAGGNVNIRATGAGEASNVVIQGSSVQAGGIVDLQADNKVQLLAAQNTASQTSTDKSSSGSIGISIGASGFGVTVAASMGRGNADGNDVTQTNTEVRGSQVNIKSGGDTDIKGAVVTADTVKANVGGNLNVQSLQDTSAYKESSESIGGSLTIGAGVSGSISASKSNIASNYASVTEQSGIRAGDGGFQVQVAGRTDLKGGAITSTQAAVDQDKNNFASAGGVTTSDIQNRASYEAKSVGINIGTSVSLDGKLTPQATGAGIGKDGGSANSITQAAISGIAGNKGARTGEVEAGIKPIFDQQKVKDEINAQVAVTQEFGRQASKAVGDYASTQIKKADALRTRAGAEADPDKRNSLNALASQLENEWGDTGTLRVAAHTVIGGLTGGVSGAAGATAGTLSAPAIADALAKAGVDGPLATALTGLGSTIVGTAAGGTAGGAAALNEVANNYLTHAEATQREALKDKQRKGTLTSAEKTVLENLDVTDIMRDLALRDACSVQGDACDAARRSLNAALGTYTGATAVYNPRLSVTGNVGVNAERDQNVALSSDPKLASQTLLDSFKEFAGPQLAGYAVGAALGAYLSEARAIYAGIKAEASLIPSGRLIGTLDGLTAAEKSFIGDMVAGGKTVQIIPSSNVGRSADFLINGTKYELKTMSNVASTTSDGLSKSLSSTVMDARGQSGNIIIDARGQVGMTPEIAERGIVRALGRDTETGAKIKGVSVITSQGTVFVPRLPQ